MPSRCLSPHPTSRTAARLSSRSWFILGLWMAIATALRFWNLGQLPPWTDELATMVFGLGHSFLGVPLNQWIDGGTLLEPLRVQAGTGLADVSRHLLNESTHPPFYFGLAQGWMQAGTPLGELLSVEVARSLPAILGVLSVPSAFGLSWIVLRSPLAAQMTAALMAISPLNIYWAREARHYTLALLLVMASLACFMRALRSLRGQSGQGLSGQGQSGRGNSSHPRPQAPLPWSLVLAWSITNVLGVATHYFFVLSLMAQGLVLLKLAWQQRRQLYSRPWLRMVPVLSATLAGVMVWLPSITAIQANPASQWIATETGISRWLMPPLRLLMWSITFLTQLPSAISIGLPLPLIIVSMVVMVSFSVWLTTYLWRLRQPALNTDAEATSALASMGEYIGFSLLLFLLVTYFADKDLSQAPRFTFVFYGAVMVYLGALLERGWRRVRPGVITIVLVSLCGAVTVLSNTGYLQHHRPDVITTVLQENALATEQQASTSKVLPTLIATTHQHHGQTGRMMGVELALRDRGSLLKPQYFLAHRDSQTQSYDEAIAQLRRQLSGLPRPFDFWLLNFRAEFDPEDELGCPLDRDYRGSLGEYRYKLYRCR